MDMSSILGERTRLLKAVEENKAQLARLSDLMEADTGSGDSPDSPSIATGETGGAGVPHAQTLDVLLGERARLERAYLALLPRIRIARCPFTGVVVEKTVDTYGLDGLWWDYAQPVRPLETCPDTWLGLSGSLALKDPLPTLPHVVMPGPSVPVVCAGLLAQPDVRAVLSAVTVGPWQGVAVSWFARHDRQRFIPPNEWGAPWCDVPEGDGFSLRGPSVWQLPDDDTDLAAWIRRGKLFWIAPGDDTLLLRADTGACPYLGMDGDGRLQYLVAGTLSHVGMTDADMRTENMTDEAFAAAMQLLRDEAAEEED